MTLLDPLILKEAVKVCDDLIQILDVNLFPIAQVFNQSPEERGLAFNQARLNPDSNEKGMRLVVNSFHLAFPCSAKKTNVLLSFSIAAL